MGYTGSKRGIDQDDVLMGTQAKKGYASYHFVPQTYPGRLSEIEKAITDTGNWEKDDYKMFSHNCQDFVSAVREKLRNEK